MFLCPRKLVWTMLFVAYAALATPQPSGAATWRLNGKGTETDLVEAPYFVEVKVAVPDGVYDLVGPQRDSAAVAVVFHDGSRRILATILARVPANQSFSYSLEPRSPSASSASGIRFR